MNMQNHTHAITLKEKMILTLIGEKERATQDDEINEYGELITSQNNYDSYESMLDSLGQKSDDVKLEEDMQCWQIRFGHSA